MKTNLETDYQYFDNLAEQWSDAYSADSAGREVSILIICAMFDFGLTPEQVEWVYRSKHLRWFFDRSSGSRQVTKKNAFTLFKDYLCSDTNGVMSDFKNPKWPEV